MSIRLPEALLQSDDYLELNEKQAFNIQARFDYIDEIVDKIADWLDGKGGYETFDDFLNDLELDVAVNLSINTGDDHESTWVIHTSWGDGVSEKVSQNKLPTDVLTVLDADLPKLNAEDAVVNTWLQDQRDALRRALETLSVAADFATAISSILAVDILMAKLLSGLYKLRFK